MFGTDGLEGFSLVVICFCELVCVSEGFLTFWRGLEGFAVGV